MIMIRELDSTAVKKIAYNTDNGELFVQFTSGPKSYRYENVPAYHIDNLLKAESIGRYFAQNIKQYATKNYL